MKKFLIEFIISYSLNFMIFLLTLPSTVSLKQNVMYSAVLPTIFRLSKAAEGEYDEDFFDDE